MAPAGGVWKGLNGATRRERAWSGSAAQDYPRLRDLPRGRSTGAVQRGRSGRKADWPELAKVLRLAKVTGATLVIAKLDRLSRNVAFLLALRDSAVRFDAVDMPEANYLTVGIMALVAQAKR